jgi:predicted AAA+ superfamily ATPase
METRLAKTEQYTITLHTNPAEQIRAALHASYGLTLLHGVLADEVGQALLQLLQLLTTPQTAPDHLQSVARAYSNAYQQIASAAYQDGVPHLVDAWQAHLIARLIDDSNLWSTQIERHGAHHIAPALRAQAQRDLHTLQRLFVLDAQQLWKHVRDLVSTGMPELAAAWGPWLHLAPPQADGVEREETASEKLAQQIAHSQDWSALVTPLEQHWSRYGTGHLAHFHVLRWQNTTRQLEGIAHPDPISLSNLIGHERQQSRIITNIERFIAGLPAHDMLLYGPPGTGKSSTIKAIANTYAQQGLCLVEVSKENINDLSQVAATLRGRAPRYLLFIDDLSFEEHDTSYKTLKVLLEGTAEARPHNILICTTSNRMNLVRENFSERGKPTEDVNWRDTMDEKQSLVHRFGLRINFMTPDQAQYLRIVSELVQQRALAIPEEELRTRALQWERQHSGRSGRSARQFVDDLEAELKYQTE